MKNVNAYVNENANERGHGARLCPEDQPQRLRMPRLYSITRGNGIFTLPPERVRGTWRYHRR
ncbi:MAG: hypothetical protein K9N52_03145 [Verrucomicrobia bacterium]|nr:hypothetical protein [Verrucomicrobiota bacterium]